MNRVVGFAGGDYGIGGNDLHGYHRYSRNHLSTSKDLTTAFSIQSSIPLSQGILSSRHSFRVSERLKKGLRLT